MDIDRPGAVFVGTTAVMALMDGALLATVGAAAVGLGVFAVLCRQLVKVDDHGFRRRERMLRADVARTRNKERRKEKEAQLALDLKDLKSAQEEKVGAGQSAAALVALGTFAFPIAGLGTAAALVAMQLTGDKE